MSTKTKYIIGLGCSWTQGEGGYPDEIVKEYNGRVQKSNRCKNDYHLRKYEHENSWVNVLCRDYFTDHIPVNLGVKGCGNRAAVHQLNFCDIVDWQNATGTVILMMSGMERYDFLVENPKHKSPDPDHYSNGEFVHNKWRTAWPYDKSDGEPDPVWSVYARYLWSEQFQACHAMLVLLDLENFCKARNFNLVIANGFNSQNSNGVKAYLSEYAGGLVDKLDWNNYFHNFVDYHAMLQKLIELDGLVPVDHYRGGYFNYYQSRDWPAKYLTNCEGAHPTIEGYKVIADELAKFIKYKGYA